MIRFLKECELEVVESFDVATETTKSTLETFEKGEELDADLVECSDENHTTIQFGDGSVVLSVPNVWFEVMTDNEAKPDRSRV